MRHVTLEFSNTTLPAKFMPMKALQIFKGERHEKSYADRKGKYMKQLGVTLPNFKFMKNNNFW